MHSRGICHFLLLRIFLIDEQHNDTHEVKEATCIKDVLEALQPLPGDFPARLTVNRSSILFDSVSHFKQRNFDFKKQLKVTFEGEPAIDGGGPKREFFPIILRALLSPSATPRLFEGRNDIFLLMHNSAALRSNLYKVAGRMVAASIFHGGPGFHIFQKQFLPTSKTLNQII